MIAVDTNVLVQAHRRDAPFHDEARACVAELAQGRWAIPWPCVHEFFAVVTHRRIFPTPSSARDALDQIAAWSESPGLRLLHETDGHLDQLAGLATAARTTGPQIHDARIAAICIGNGVTELLTADRDFSRFPTLLTRNPLVVG